MQEDCKKPHLVDLLPFLIVSSTVEKILVSTRFCHFGRVYTTRQVWKSRSVQFLRYSGVRHTDRHFSKPFTVTLPKREGQLYYIIERCPLLLKVTPVIIELMKRCEVLRGAHCYSWGNEEMRGVERWPLLFVN